MIRRRVAYPAALLRLARNRLSGYAIPHTIKFLAVRTIPRSSAPRSFIAREVLTNPGKTRADVAERLALERFEEYEAAHLERERIAADEADIAEVERIGKELGKE